MCGHWLRAGLALLVVGSAHAAEFKPYVAYINSDDVYVRSGPGKNYYPTVKLKRGEEVEIYRHDPGGWYAIRPPRQSFSWVSARQVDALGNKLATISVDRAVARVGSTFSDVRDVIQVRLNRGEKVELLDDQPVADGKWYKIAPPAGEFRWIYKDFIDREPPAVVAAAEPTDEDDADVAPTRKARRRAGDIQLTSGEGEEDDQPVAAEPPRRAASNSTARSVPAKSAPAKAGRRDEPKKSFADTMAGIDLDLSAMVAEELSTWSFEDLRLRADRLLDRAPTAIERGQVRLLMSKIDRFAELKDRHDTINRVRTETALRNRQAGRTDVARREDGPRFDANGRLSPVVSQKDGSPPFVLLDNRGNIVSYVTPAPGMNLRPYVDRQVGVNGQRGFIPEQQVGHVNVQHVTVLPDVSRRY